MRILVVDDSDSKREHVVRLLQQELHSEYDLTLDEAKDYETALIKLRTEFYDLVILDLMLPGAGRDPSEETSKQLILLALRGETVPPTHIIGLTEYADRAENEQGFYDEHLLALEIYDALKTDWAKRLCSRIRYLVASKKAAAQFRANSYDLDVVVLTARYQREFRPIKTKIFREVTGTSHPLWSGEITLGTIDGPNGKRLRAALLCVGEMGVAPTAAIAMDAINVLRPRVIAMLGMCCGFHTQTCATPQRLADTIVVRDADCWEEGKYVEREDDGDPEFRNRSVGRSMSESIRGDIQFAVESADDTLKPRLTRIANGAKYKEAMKGFRRDEVRLVPEVRFGTMVSGSSVVADEAMVEEILERHPGAIGLDMEVYGLYTAVERSTGARPAVFAVKAVADFGRSDKGKKVQEVASMVAAEVFKGLVERLTIFVT
jgi:nucleoside phosphorylase